MACSISLAFASSDFRESTFSSDEDLDPRGDDGLLDELPDLLPAVGDVHPGILESCPGRLPDLPQPLEVPVVGEGLRVGHDHVHALAEPPEGRLELRTGVLGLQHGDALVEVALVPHLLEEPQDGRVPGLKPGQLVTHRGEPAACRVRRRCRADRDRVAPHRDERRSEGKGGRRDT